MNRPNLSSLWAGILSSKKRDFLVTPEGRYSYRDLADAIGRWLAAFDEGGLESGDRVIICTDQEFGAISCFIAALLDGLVPVQLSSDTPDERVIGTHSLVSAGMMVSDFSRALPSHLSGVKLIGKDERPRPLFGLGRKADRIAGLIAKQAAREPHLPTDDAALAYILFTSGTTSRPSGVKISRGSLFAQLTTLTRLFGYDSSSRIFNDMVLAHADGFIQGPILALANQCAAIRAGGFDLGRLEEWLNTARQERATHIITVPTVWNMIDAYAQHDDYFDSRECQALLSVAAKLPPALWDGIETRFGKPLFNQYGLTETVVSALYAGNQSEMGRGPTIGRPVDCDARIDPQSSHENEGELQLRGDNVFSGYWQDDARTSASFTDDGWFKTGDLARFDEDGNFEILSRIKSVIMVGGFLIQPDELDEAIMLHPSVRESVSVGIEDEMFGEVPVTGVVSHGAVTETELISFARSKMEQRKVPKRIIFLEKIPRGDSGKPRLTELRDILTSACVRTDGDRLGGAEQTASSDTLGQAVLSLAEDIFQTPPGVLMFTSRAGDFPGWDSFSQLSFVLAAEQQFGITIPASRIASIASISDMIDSVEELKR